MFVHKNKLEYQLQSSHYFSDQQLSLEVEDLFQPGWHLIGTVDDLSKDGDYLTFELLGKPIIVHRFNSDFVGFLNVCAHRHCTLTDEPCGNMEQLTCQYHGWQYKSDGFTAKIPDAKCFRPFDRDRARLKAIRVERCGNLIFASIAESGQTLREYLGDFFDTIEKFFKPPWKQNWAVDFQYDCNWKVPLENTVETYHLPSVHKGTFGGIYPSEEAQTHDLGERHTTLTYDLSEDPLNRKRIERAAKILGGYQPSNQYVHHHAFPNLVFTFSDIYVHAQVYFPISPTKTLTRIRMFALEGTNRGPVAWLARKLVPWIGRKSNLEIQNEDAAVFQPTQKGLENTQYRGIIGTREERIYAFQKYVAKHAGRKRAEDASTMSDRDNLQPG